MDFEIDGKKYRSTRLASLTSLEIARRYGNPLVFIGDVRKRTEVEAPGSTTPAQLGRALVLATMDVPVHDQQFVVGTCLSAVFRLGEQNSALPIREPTTGRMMFEDISDRAIAEIVFRVLDDHGLIDFFADPPAAGKATGQPPK